MKSVVAIIGYLKQVRIIKFGMVGASGALIGLSILWALTEIGGLYYLVSYIISTLVAVTNNWYFNSIFTFKHKPSLVKWAKYLGASTGTLLLNVALMYVFTSLLGVWYMLSAVVVITIIFLLNFYLSKKYVWK